MSGKYDDIIDLPHHVSATRPQMSMAERAAQFSPFAALTGYDAVLRETSRLVERKIELSEDSRAELDRKQQLLSAYLAAQPPVTVRYFIWDAYKYGGSYVTVSGRLKRVDSHQRILILTDGTQIPFDDILQLDSPLFPSPGNI